MTKMIINLSSAAVVLAGGVFLDRPARAAAVSECTPEQWQAAENAANAYCQGASYTISCHDNVVVVAILDCPAGNG
jgi:hypothetical protein